MERLLHLLILLEGKRDHTESLFFSCAYADRAADELFLNTQTYESVRSHRYHHLFSSYTGGSAIAALAMFTSRCLDELRWGLSTRSSMEFYANLTKRTFDVVVATTLKIASWRSLALSDPPAKQTSFGLSSGAVPYRTQHVLHNVCESRGRLYISNNSGVSNTFESGEELSMAVDTEYGRGFVAVTILDERAFWEKLVEKSRKLPLAVVTAARKGDAPFCNIYHALLVVLPTAAAALRNSLEAEQHTCESSTDLFKLYVAQVISDYSVRGTTDTFMDTDGVEDLTITEIEESWKWIDGKCISIDSPSISNSIPDTSGRESSSMYRGILELIRPLVAKEHCRNHVNLTSGTEILLGDVKYRPMEMDGDVGIIKLEKFAREIGVREGRSKSKYPESNQILDDFSGEMNCFDKVIIGGPKINSFSLYNAEVSDFGDLDNHRQRSLKNDIMANDVNNCF
jgi:hypothetical protein